MIGVDDQRPEVPGKSTLSRLQFVTTVGMAAAASALLPLGSEVVLARATQAVKAPGRLGMQSFLPYVGQRFRVRAGGTERSLRLADVTRLPAAVPEGDPLFEGAESFRLLFHGMAWTSLKQGTYRFSHPSMGAFPLFIVPMGRRDRAETYEAVFNHLPAAL